MSALDQARADRQTVLECLLVSQGILAIAQISEGFTYRSVCFRGGLCFKVLLQFFDHHPGATCFKPFLLGIHPPRWLFTDRFGGFAKILAHVIKIDKKAALLTKGGCCLLACPDRPVTDNMDVALQTHPGTFGATNPQLTDLIDLLVGTPKGRLRKFERELLEPKDWQQVESGVEVKLVGHPDGQGRERYVLCRSKARHEKEAAILHRQRDRLRTKLTQIDASLRKRRAKPESIERRIGKWLGRNTAAENVFQVEVITQSGWATGLHIQEDESKLN